MKLKAVLPWLFVLGLAVALGMVYSSNQQQAADLAKLRQDSDELQKVRAAAEEAKGNQTQAETEELTRLRKEHDELLKLRNDIGQMRVEKDQLAKQAMAAKQPVANPEEQQQLQQLVAENLRLKATAQQTQLTGQQVVCINNLRQIEAAKQQWALENQKPPGSLVGPQDIAPYMPSKAVPVCPAGGVYTINPIGISPICNIPNHILPNLPK
jgi:hypothetical protein